MSSNDSNNPDNLEDYGDSFFSSDLQKIVNERNSSKLMKAQYKEIADQQKYRKESKKTNSCFFKLTIVSIIVAIMTLIIAYLTLKATK